MSDPSGHSPLPGSGSGSRPDPQFLTASLFDRPDADVDAADDLALRLGPGAGYDSRQQQRDPSNGGGSGAGDELLDLNAPPLGWDCLGTDPSNGGGSGAGDELLDLNAPPLGWDCLGTDEDEDERGFDEELERAELEWAEIIEGILEERGEISFDQEPVELLFDDNEGFAYTNSDYEELTVDQFHDSGVKGNPPAARSAVEGLPSFVLSKEEGCGSIGCAVCNEEMWEGERGRRLPCSHCYHEGCILQWLEVGNTCPLCRHELPTDDPDYESCKAGRDADANASALAAPDDDSIIHDFDMLPEAY